MSNAAADYDPAAPHGVHVERQDAQRAERADDALRLRQRGLSYRQIGARLGIHHSTAQDLVSWALREVVAESVTELRKIENARLDAIDAELDRVIADPPHIVAASGTVTAQQDLRVAVQALEVKIRNSARRARLNGLDMPTITIREQRADAELNARITAALAQVRALVESRQIALPVLTDDDDDAA